MKKLLLASVVAALLLIVISAAHAAEKGLPKEFWGKWCANESVTGGGSPRFWMYLRHGHCEEPRRFDSSYDATIGPYSMDDCKALKHFEWKEDGHPVYFVTFRCKNGKRTAKFSMDEDGLTIQYLIGK